MMRQAGRYLPGYRSVREKTPFLDLCASGPLSAQVSLEPVERFDVDAAIVFADILLTASAMGAPVVFDESGPRIPRPVRTLADAESLRAPDLARIRGTLEAITILRHSLPPTKAVIGFSAAPFTLACYLIEGGTSRDFHAVRRMLHVDPDGFHAILDRCATALVPYLGAQREAGADVLMLFDTWGGIATPEHYRDLVAPAIRRVLDGLGSARPPTILFPGLCAGSHLDVAASTGASALSVDWRVDLRTAYGQVGDRVRLQGNLDPAALYAKPDAISAAVHAMLDAVPAGRPHLVNLGHGILPDIPVDHADAFVRAAQAYRPKKPARAAVSP